MSCVQESKENSGTHERCVSYKTKMRGAQLTEMNCLCSSQDDARDSEPNLSGSLDLSRAFGVIPFIRRSLPRSKERAERSKERAEGKKGNERKRSEIGGGDVKRRTPCPVPSPSLHFELGG